MPSSTSLVVPGLHGAFIPQRLPDWLKHANAEDLARLRRHWLPEPPVENAELTRYQAQSRRSTAALASALQGLQGIASFAEPLLKARLHSELGLELDVNTVEFVHIQHETILLGSLLQTRPRQQSLLQAALQNFAADVEIDPGSAVAPKDAFGLERMTDSGQGVPRFRYRYSERLAVAPQRFARLCHALDLGGRYQRHLRDIYEASATQAELRRRWIAAQRDQLRVSIQTAFLRQEIGAAARQMLLALVQGERAPLFNGKPVRISQLKMFEKPLAEVLVIGADRTASDQLEAVIVYLPGAPLYPLKEYPTARAAQDDLRVSLRLPGFQQALRGYLLHSDQAHVLARLDEALYHLVEGSDGVYQRQPNPNGKLYLRELPVTGELFGHLFERHVFKLKADARVLAVPSADADEQAREARLAAWESLGFNLLNAAAFFIPALGAVMAAVTAVQVVREVVTGVEDWEQGDLAEAWEHLSAVGLNLALMVGLGLAGQTALPLRGSALIDGLVKVRLPGGEQRLWQPMLAPYAAAVELAGSEPDGQGVYLHGNRRYVRIEGCSHEVQVDEQGVWRLKHPSDATAYQPELRHNGQGAWRLQGENPLRWHGLRLWRRLGHLAEGLSDDDLREVSATSGVDDARLRRLHLDNEPLPALLEDALVRQRLHRRVDALISLLRQGRTQATALPLAVLTRMPDWPVGVLLRVMEGDHLLGEYGLPLAEGNRVLSLNRAQLGSERCLQQVLGLLDEPEQKRLIGPYLAATLEVRGGQLREAIAGFASANRGLIFDSLYSSETLPVAGVPEALRRDFPALPGRLAEALAARASSREREQLLGAAPRVPLRLAEEARWLRDELRLNRACEGLFRGYQDSADIRRLALAQLQRLPGWSASVALEVRADNWRGELLEQIGAASAAQKKYLLRLADGYQALNEDGQELAGIESLYAALLHALPDSERAALDLPIDQPERLRRLLAQAAVDDREAARSDLRLRSSKPWFRPPLQIEDSRFGYPLSGRGEGQGLRSPALYECTRQLYPDLALEEINLLFDGLGLDEQALPGWLEAKQVELTQLKQALLGWVQQVQAEEVSPQHFRLVAPQTRRNVADAIERCWRRQSPQHLASDGRFIGYRLSLNGQRLLNLPTLLGDFSHVTELQLDGMGLRELPASFTRVFTRLRWLRAGHNNFERLPATLADFAGLTRLHLHYNAIVLNAEASAVFARLPNLRRLQLDGNPLALAPDVSALSELRSLLLSDTEIAAWPNGVFSLRQLETLDLRENRISQIPSRVLAPPAEEAEAIDQLNRGTSLHGNPLDADSTRRLIQYRVRTGISLGITARVRSPHVSASRSALDISANWLVGDAEALFQSRQALWLALLAEPDSGGFFQLLNDLRASAEFKLAYPELKDRVWQLLGSASDDSVLRQQLFEAANHPQTCADGVLLVFNQLEIRGLVRQALTAGSQIGVERRLIRLARGLFRLDRVEQIALRDIAARRAAGLSVDDVEIRLAYRMGLSESLELPGQSRHMAFRELAAVTEEALQAARAEVLAAQTVEALRAELVERDFWVAFLKQQFSNQFDAVNKPYFARLDALEKDIGLMTDKIYKQRVETLSKRRQTEENRLLARLTVDIWNTTPGLTPRL